jgi:hypothetical protein
MSKFHNLEDTLQALYNLDFKGNIIPHTWYKEIVFDNGKPDLQAITIELNRFAVVAIS